MKVCKKTTAPAPAREPHRQLKPGELCYLHNHVGDADYLRLIVKVKGQLAAVDMDGESCSVNHNFLTTKNYVVVEGCVTVEE